MPIRRLHPVVAALIAYPLAAWLTMGCMFVAAGHDADDDDAGHGLDRNELIVLAAAPVVLPFLLLLGALSDRSLEHRQLLVYGSIFVVAWLVCWILLRFLWTRLRAAKSNATEPEGDEQH
jgi:hypothetical protein